MYMPNYMAGEKLTVSIKTVLPSGTVMDATMLADSAFGGVKGKMICVHSVPTWNCFCST